MEITSEERERILADLKEEKERRDREWMARPLEERLKIQQVSHEYNMETNPTYRVAHERMRGKGPGWVPPPDYISPGDTGPV